MSTQTSILLKVLLFLIMTCSFVAYNNLYDIGDVTEYVIVAFFIVAFGGIFLNQRRNDRKKRKAERLDFSMKILLGLVLCFIFYLALFK